MNDTTTKINDGGPAFPQTVKLMNKGFPDMLVPETTGGMTKREEYAKAAMQGLLSNAGGPVQSNSLNGWGLTNCEPKDVAWLAVQMADAMIAELAK